MKESHIVEFKEVWRDEYLNPLVANVFFRAGEVEAWGRGMQQIMDTCKEAGTPPPKIEYQPGDLWLEFPYSPEYLRMLPAAGSVRRLDGKLDEKLDEKLGATRAAIITLVRDDPRITVTRLAAHLNLSRTAVDKNIQILKSRGYLKRIGPAKGGHWEVCDA